MNKQNIIIVILGLLLAGAVGALVWIFINFNLSPKILVTDNSGGVVSSTPSTTPEVEAPKEVIFNSQTFTSSTPSSTISIFYPYLSSASTDAVKDDFNSMVSTTINKILAVFQKNQADTKAPINATSTLMLAYDVKEQNQNFYSALFGVEQYVAGSAHPSHSFIAVNYDLKNGAVVKLSDLFNPNEKYLDFLSEYTSKELLARNEKNKFSDEEIIKTGTEAKEENFSIFNISKEGLVVTFPEYQVAPYVAGEQTVVVPWDAFGNSIVTMSNQQD